MGHTLIWLEGAATLLLLMALLVTWAARRRRRWSQVGLTVLAAILLLLPGVVATWAAAGLCFGRELGLPHNWFVYALSWLLAAGIGVVLVSRRGLRREADGSPAALAWPRGSLLVLLAVALVLLGITVSNLDLAAQLQIAAARAEAGEVLLAVTPPHVPDKDNAAPLYRQAFALLPPASGSPDWQALLRVRADAQEARKELQAKAVKDVLAAQKKTLTLLRQAAAMPACSFEHSYRDLPDAAPRWEIPELGPMELSVRLLCLSALAHAAGDDGKGAALDLRAAFGVARHVPTVNALRAVIQAERVVLDVLQQVLLLTAPQAEDLARLPLQNDPPYLLKIHEEAAVHGAITVGIVSPESGLMRHLVAQYHGEPPAWLSAIAGATVVPLWRIFLVPDDLAASRQMWQDLRRQTANEPAHPTWAAARAAIEDNPGGFLTNLFMKPHLLMLTHRSIDVLTRRELARVAVALMAYRSKNGHYPDTLEKLLPAYLARVPVDPLAGRPLQMRRVGSWLMLSEAGVKMPRQGGPAGGEEVARSGAIFWLEDPPDARGKRRCESLQFAVQFEGEQRYLSVRSGWRGDLEISRSARRRTGSWRSATCSVISPRPSVRRSRTSTARCSSLPLPARARRASSPAGWPTCCTRASTPATSWPSPSPTRRPARCASASRR
jgi:hypothetical protein